MDAGGVDNNLTLGSDGLTRDEGSGDFGTKISFFGPGVCMDDDNNGGSCSSLCLFLFFSPNREIRWNVEDGNGG